MKRITFQKSDSRSVSRHDEKSRDDVKNSENDNNVLDEIAAYSYHVGSKWEEFDKKTKEDDSSKNNKVQREPDSKHESSEPVANVND